MKIIDQYIIGGLKNMRLKFSTQKEMATALGISSMQVGQLLKNKVSHFNDDTWTRIKPILLPYIEEYIAAMPPIAMEGDCRTEILMRMLLSIPKKERDEISERLIENTLLFERHHLESAGIATGGCC